MGSRSLEYSVDEEGEITAVVLRVTVVYTSGGEELRKREEVDIWPLLNQGQQTAEQAQFDTRNSLFNTRFLD